MGDRLLKVSRNNDLQVLSVLDIAQELLEQEREEVWSDRETLK